MTRLARTVCWGLAGAFTLAGGVAWVLPPRVRVAPVAPVAPEAPATPTLVINTTAAEEIVLGNVFSSTRTPPAVRYTPPEFATDSGAGMLPVPGAAGEVPMLPDSATLAGDVPRLFGTVVAATGPRALLQLSLAAGPRLYATGEREGGYTVLAITPREVVLRGPGGRRTLRLDPEE